ncbi:sigma-70 family RNA polymerase sigma factor [bacterium]|nr:sigma-70 family RNA polymerase sigma factor [bacterium]
MQAGAEPTDERLVASARAGDHEAFAALVRRHKSRVLATAARFARNDHELDDLAQQVFVKTYRRLDTFRGEAPFSHWLARVTVRTCYDHLRARYRDRGLVPLGDGGHDPPDLAADREWQATEARDLLAFALARLAPADRLVITLLELEERSVREIASLTGWTPINVKVRAYRARRALKRILETHHER